MRLQFCRCCCCLLVCECMPSCMGDTVGTLKRWETRGPQRILVIESYGMGFGTSVMNGQTEVKAFIEYL